MTEEHEKEIAARVREAESVEAGIRSELKRDMYDRKDIVAALAHQGVVPPFADAACRKRYDAGDDDAAIAAYFGLTPWNILCWRHEHKLPRKEKTEKMTCEEKKITDERKLALYREGKNDGEIAAAVGVTASAVGQWRKKRGLTANSGPAARPRPEEPPREKPDASLQITAPPEHFPADQPDREEELEEIVGDAAVKALSGAEIDEVLAHAGEVMEKAMPVSPAPADSEGLKLPPPEPAEEGIKDMISEANCLAMKAYNIAPALIAVMLTREEIDLLQQLICGEVETGVLDFEQLRRYMAVYENLQKAKERYGKDE